MALPESAFHPHFNDAAADIVIEAADAFDDQGSRKDGTTFRLHSQALVSMSPVFADMFNIGTAKSHHADQTEAIRLSESGAILELLLAFSHNDIEKMPPIASMSFLSLAAVYETCIKYQMAVPQMLLETHMLSVHLHTLADADQLNPLQREPYLSARASRSMPSI